jgi:hypothetical protein
MMHGERVETIDQLQALPVGSRVILDGQIGAERVSGADHWHWVNAGMVVDSDHCMAFDNVIVDRVGPGRQG